MNYMHMWNVDGTEDTPIRLRSGHKWRNTYFPLFGRQGFMSTYNTPENQKKETLENVSFYRCGFRGDGKVLWLFNLYEVAGPLIFNKCTFTRAGVYPEVTGQQTEGHALYTKLTNGGSLYLFRSRLYDCMGNGVQIVNRQKESVFPQQYPDPKHGKIVIRECEFSNLCQGEERGSWAIACYNPGQNVLIENTVISFGTLKRNAGGILIGDAQDRTQRCDKLSINRTIVAQHGIDSSVNPALQLQGVNSAFLDRLLFVGSPSGARQRVIIDTDCGPVRMTNLKAPFGVDIVLRTVEPSGHTTYLLVKTIEGSGNYTYVGEQN